MTLLAYASWIATSSTETGRTWAGAPPVPTAAGALSPVPKPPTTMLAMDRFMASAISLVRMPPEELTSMPAMISAVSSRTKPAIATADPVKAFSRAMTTGMSAPPIGSTIVTPKSSATATSPYSAIRESGASTSQSVPTAKDAGSRTLSSRAPGNTTGEPDTMPCSLPAATSDPEKVTAPMTMSSPPGSETRAPSAAG